MAFLQRQINRGSVSTGYDIENSCKFEADNREYLRWTNFSSQASAARKKKFTFSVWVKRTELGGNQQVFISTSQNGYLTFEANNQLTWIQQYGGSQLVINTTRVFRDTSAWYHIMVVVDTAQSTEADRTKIYVNGEQETVFDAAAYPSQNAEASNLFEQHLIVGEWGGTSLGFCGYMAEYYFLSEIAASPTDLGEFDEDSGIWKPKAYSGTISSPSHFLEFKDGSDLGTATSGLDSDYQNNLTAADQSTDTPTNNFCTLNYINKCADTTMTDGATNCDRTNNGNNTVRGTMAVTKGKWYWEVHVGRGTVNTNYPFSGMTGNLSLNPCVWTHEDAQTFSVSGSGNVTDVSTHRGTGTAAAYSNATPAYSIYGFAVDIDNETLIWSTNGTANNSGNTYSLARSVGASTEGMTPMLFMFTGAQQSFNFGGYSIYPPSSAESDANGYGTFEYAPPSGYYALCGKNLAEYG